MPVFAKSGSLDRIEAGPGSIEFGEDILRDTIPANY